MTDKWMENPPSPQKRVKNQYSPEEEKRRKAGKTASEGLKPIRSIDEEKAAAEEAKKRELEEQETDGQKELEQE